MQRAEMTQKIAVLGVDGFDPSLAKKFMKQGKMPNLQKFVEEGACAKDMVLLGNLPTVTPPMWTTLATGATSRTHGITAFFNPHPDPEKMEILSYALDSRLCQAEQLWNVFAEGGKRTLVWHWPGSSWPPSSDSPLLHVVDGTQPASVNFGTAIVDWEKIGVASNDFAELRFASHDAAQAGAGCVITGLEENIAEEGTGANGADILNSVTSSMETELIFMSKEENEVNLLGNVNLDYVNSPITEPAGWTAAPAGAREFTILTSGGYTRRPCLLLPNDEGVYERVAYYHSKKDVEPLAILRAGEYTASIIDEVNVDGELKPVHRCMTVLELAGDGSKVRLWLGMALDIHQDSVFHPKSLLAELQDNIGYVPAVAQVSGSDPELVERVMLPSWDYYSQWQADCLTYLMDNDRYDVIFSHLHNVDLVGHQLWHFAKHREEWHNDEALYQGFIQYVYEQTDRYLGRFLPYLASGWTFVITSDHGLMTELNETPGLGEGAVNIPIMRELGYTVMQKDAEGNDLRKIDWSKTTAIAMRSGHIYLNVQGRTSHGIVAPSDQYELEAQIISDLYNYRDEITGKRVVALALRNRDAIVLGTGGRNAGDILYYMEEGYNIIHADSLSTQRGYCDTSVSPIFVAAGSGIKKGFTTDRVIRQVDVAPTLAVLGGVRMPAQCEGAPAYQILAEEF